MSKLAQPKVRTTRFVGSGHTVFRNRTCSRASADMTFSSLSEEAELFISVSHPSSSAATVFTDSSPGSPAPALEGSSRSLLSDELEPSWGSGCWPPSAVAPSIDRPRRPRRSVAVRSARNHGVCVHV